MENIRNQELVKEISDLKYAIDESALVAITDHRGRITYVNDKFCQTSKFERSELVGRHHRVISSGRHAKEFIRELWSTIQQGKTWRGDIENRAKDGSIFWVDTTIVPLLDANNEPYQYTSIRFDITERKRIDLALAAATERELAVIRNALDVICTIDADGNFASMSPASTRMWGYDPQELIGASYLSLVVPEDVQKTVESAASNMSGQELTDFENRYRHKNGSIVDLMWTSHWSEAEQLMFSVAHDITERKRIDLALADATERELAVIRNAPDVICTIDADGNFASMNPASLKMWGYEPKELIGNSYLALVVSDDVEKTRESAATNLSGRELTYFENRYTHKNGSIISLMWTSHWSEDDQLMFSVAHDITARKRAEDELSNFAKQLKRSNAELQDFASVAAHDLQEPLRKIQAYGERLKDKCGEALGDDGAHYLDRMQNAAGRMQTLINDLMTFARVTIMAKPFEPVDLRLVAEGVLSDLEMRIESTNGRVEIGDLGTIDADATQMRQLIQNMVGNALKYGRAGVPPVVKVSGRVERNRPDPDGLGGSYDNYKLTVEDNGIGFESKYVDRIFKVFQRLHGRTEYEGTGIGLAVCRKITERHGGTISVDSVPDKGTVFTVDLPVHHREEIINEYF